MLGGLHMFYLTAKVGTMFAVYDDTDNSVEWFNKTQLDQYLGIGVQIMGYSLQEVKPVRDRRVSYQSCYWTKTRKNIFDVVERVVTSGDNITIFAEGKKYKCKILDHNSTYCSVIFSNGLNVMIPMEWLKSYI